MTLLTTQAISLFGNLTNISDGFRVPDKAYVHGSDFHCFEQLGSDLYFSNYWYGDKKAVQSFAESLASYFQAEYNKIQVEPGDYDFFGMVVMWNMGDKAMVANINLEEDLAFWDYEKNIPPVLEQALKTSQLKLLLSDGNDNGVLEILHTQASKKVKQKCFDYLVADEYKADYIEAAKDKGINIVENKGFNKVNTIKI